MVLKFKEGWEPIPSGRCMPTLGSYLGRKINMLIEKTTEYSDVQKPTLRYLPVDLTVGFQK